ncbi:MAG: S9 family peptidase [Clostridia bacterium]|nr:S9 family peptidase [Clostridia bacterium]
MSAETPTTPLRLADYYDLKIVARPAVSPDGTRVAFTVTGFRKGADDRYTHLWIAPVDGSFPPHRLTRGDSNDEAPAWSPDGTKLAFLSTRPDEIEVAESRARAAEEKGKKAEGDKPPPKPKPQIWVLDFARGGEPRQVTHHEEGVREFDWSPDGRTIVFAARAPSEDQAKYLKSVREEKGPLVLRRAQHKYDGRGFLDDVRTHLFLVAVEGREVRQITDGPCDETSPRFSPDGRWIAFLSNRTGDADNNRRTDAWLVSPDGQTARRLTLGDVGIAMLSFSPDGEWLALVGSREPENAYKLAHLFAVRVADARPVPDLAACVGEGWASVGGVVPDLAPEELRALSEAERVARARVYPVAKEASPLRALSEGLDRPVVGPPVWLDGETVAAPVGDRGQTRVGLFRLSGPAVLGLPFDRGTTVTGFDAAGGWAALVLDRPEQGGGEVAAVRAADLAQARAAEVRLVTGFHAELRARRALCRYERISFRNGDGQEIEGFVAIPPGWSPEKGPAPLLVTIHGGPMAYDSPSFRFEKQYWAGMGYLVLMVNYRGSTSYGEAFCEVIRGDWGPREHDDVMSGVEHLVRLGWADPERLYVTGFSQGGIMTNWAVGHTDRFRAAVSEHGMWDYAAAFGTDDCHLWWQDDLGVPWQNPEGYARISPKSGLARIRTPLLITAGEHDWRCPLDQAELLYLALKKRGVPTELVVYQDEHHAVTKPRRAIDRIRRVAEWLSRYGGIPVEDDTAEGYPSG